METNELETMSIVIVGHVDHGKSTVVGRLLVDSGTLPVGKLQQIQDYCERNSLPFEYAFLIDALKDERRQNITIDSARVFFNTDKRRYIIIDAPGHIEFVKNMVTGAARAEAALLVIDAQEGIKENSRRHGNLLSLLGVRQVSVLVNKMDLVGYDQGRFDSISQEYTSFLSQVGLEAAGYIPVSGRQGDNISLKSTNMPWYSGPTVLEALDAFNKEKSLVDRPFRLPVQDVYRFTRFGDSRRIVAGTVSSGRVRVGDQIVFYPSGKSSTIQSIESLTGPPPTEITSGQAVGITLGQQIYVSRGDIAVRVDEPRPSVTRRLRVSLFWLGKDPLVTRKSYQIKLGMARTGFQVEKILRVMDSANLEDTHLKEQVSIHGLSECIFLLDRAITFDRAELSLNTGRFVIVDGYEICGGGIVLEDLEDPEAPARRSVLQRNAHWIMGDVTHGDREEHYRQRPCLVIITGKKGTGRKSLARALEARLFQMGNIVYYLGMGSVVYGLDADIHGHSDIKDRHEHVRRLAEIANIFLDAGMILIITAVELTQADLELFRVVVDSTAIVPIWVGNGENSDLAPDMRPVEIDPLEQAITQALAGLQKDGFILENEDPMH